MATVGVAIIGGGIFAKTEHLPAVLKCDHLSLKAIYSRSLKSAEDTAALNTKGAIDLYSADSGAGKTYQDLLSREDIAAVIIALPIVSQPGYIEAALAAGKHVLAEKPLAKDVARGKKLIEYYTEIAKKNNSTFAIAENVRFMPAFTYAAEEARKLGKVNHFTVRVFSWMKQDAKWVGTEWRRKPEYQGGFLLDGGVHHAAATRLLLGGDSNKAESVRALTSLTHEYLAPIDTVNAIIKTKSGTSGTFQVSSGSLINAFEWDFGFENGTVKVVNDTVIVKPLDGEEVVKDFARTSGVSEEVAAWGEGIVTATPNPLQSPVEALADLELMEQMFNSGDQDGAQLKYELQ
ncbi:Fc.00g103310.m01.CDS01 [Cosmosporella sp. VM-42]